MLQYDTHFPTFWVALSSPLTQVDMIKRRRKGRKNLTQFGMKILKDIQMERIERKNEVTMSRDRKLSSNRVEKCVEGGNYIF